MKTQIGERKLFSEIHNFIRLENKKVPTFVLMTIKSDVAKKQNLINYTIRNKLFSIK